MAGFGQDLKSRYGVLAGVVVLVLGILLVRLWSMQIISGQSYAAQSLDNRVREVTIPAARGRIFDRSGKALVTNRATLAVTVAPSSAGNADMLARLATVLGMRVVDIQHKIETSRLQALQPRVVAIDVPKNAVAYLSEHAEQFPGVTVQVEPVRQYLMGSLGSHVLGYVGEISDAEMSQPGMAGYASGDIVGKAGVEKQYESVLQGEKGQQQLEVDAQGRVHRVLDTRQPVPGRDIRLTIDANVQRVAEKALVNAFAAARQQGFKKANAGAIVAIDVRTGAIVAMASAPAYDPGAFIGGITQKAWQSLNATGSGFPLTNRAVMSLYPPASTFKVVTGLGGLQDGLITPSTVVDCKGTWWFPGHENSAAKWWTKKCWDIAGHGPISFTNAVEQSCDSYFYSLGYKFFTTPGEKLQAFARASGYGRKTGIDLPGEVAGRVPDAAWKRSLNGTIAPEYAQWVPGDTVNMAIGQGDLLVTPLQMAQLFAAVGNGGKLLRPHLLEQVMASGGKGAALQANTVETGKLPVSAANLALMQNALLGVTTNGTAKQTFAGFAVKVAGKTGTAQVGSPNLPKNSPLRKDDYALFGGYAPADAPRYAVAVVIEQGGHGGSVAAPAAREVFAALNGLPVVHVSATDQSR
jgi:penicillin-binding protein 2